MADAKPSMKERAKPEMEPKQVFAGLPNLITLARLLLAPLSVVMIVSQRFVSAFVIFAVAGVSDALDGYIAKRFDLRTELGAYLDPLADKALLVSIYVTLALVHELPATLAIIVVFRDVMILVAVLISWLLDNPVAIRPVWVSKFNTAAQISLAALVLGGKAIGLDPLPGEDFVIWIVAASTVASGAVYIAQWLGHMSR
jgi:cardiolipin synthase (CMP-forming)